MAAFQPKGERARWRVIYDLLCAAQVDDVVTYDEMAEALDLDPGDDKHRIQMAVRRAAQEHEVVDSRALTPVPNIGYRVVRAPEHLTLAKRHQSRASKELVRGHSKAIHVDLNGVDDATRNALDTVARAFAMQLDFNRRVDVRHQRLESALASVATVAERADRTAERADQAAQRSDEEIAELKDALASAQENLARQGARLARLEGTPAGETDG